MPGDSKKDKKKTDPKEQRKPRQRHQRERTLDDKSDDGKSSATPRVPVLPQKAPVYPEPGPEFYQNLKRETDEIIKITEQENAKYRKKEIQSNWAKYEMPIESYDDIDEQDAGADYEKLIQAPLSIGGHFQFKHEKSWEATTGPSAYDKYFDINMQNLYVAISSLPFYERNDLHISMFNESEMLNMNSRANKYKHKYFNDKKYATPETEMQEKICNSLRDSLSETLERKDNNINSDEEEELNFNISISDDNINSSLQIDSENTKDIITFENKRVEVPKQGLSIDEVLVDLPQKKDSNNENLPPILSEMADTVHIVKEPLPVNSNNDCVKVTSNNSELLKKVETRATPKPDPVIESPEDLEKWLDDFLDG